MENIKEMTRDEWNAMTDDEKWDDHQALIVAFRRECRRTVEYDEWNAELSRRVFEMEHLEDNVNALMGRLEQWKFSFVEARKIMKAKADGSVDR